jgi:hypothetical protein
LPQSARQDGCSAGRAMAIQPDESMEFPRISTIIQLLIISVLLKARQ